MNNKKKKRVKEKRKKKIKEKEKSLMNTVNKLMNFSLIKM